MPKKNKFIIAPPSKPSKTAEVKYRRQLTAIISEITKMVKREIVPILKETKGAVLDSVDSNKSYIADGAISDITTRFAIIQTLLNFDEREKEGNSSRFVGMVGASASEKADRVLERAGMLLPQNKNIIARQGINEALDALTAENTALIKDIGQNYLDKIKKAVLDNYLTGKYEGKGGIIKELQRINGINKRRANLIARDQSNKIYGSVTRIRAQKTGSVGYMWNNVGDERVRGNPSGKYPDVPKTRNHWDREKKYYLWKPSNNPPLAPDGKPFRQPPKDGSPGIPINCRCYARSVWVMPD